MNKWKVGDWCFCEYELSQIKQMNKDRVTIVSNGCDEKGYYDWNDRIFPLDIKIKRLANTYEKAYKELNELSMHLNCPKIFSWFEQEWIIACKGKDDEDIQQKQWERLSGFTTFIKNEVRRIRSIEMFGVKIF